MQNLVPEAKAKVVSDAAKANAAYALLHGIRTGR
jgi:hypothetical protein